MRCTAASLRHTVIDLHQEFCSLLEQAGIANQISSSAYDTAWVARLAECDNQLAEEAVQWLLEHRLPDGGWGTKEFLHGHDRFVCTLAAMIALAKHGWDRTFLQTVRETLEKYTKCVLRDSAGPTIGFEMIVPTLMSEAREMDLIPRSDNALMRRLERVRTAKLKALSGRKITRFLTPAFSAEMVGTDTHLLDTDSLQHENGSVECSPSATAFFAMRVRPGDSSAISYLQTVSRNRNGGVPFIWPLDVFEHAWPLWNLTLIGQDNLDSETLSMRERHLDVLEEIWSPQGVPTVIGIFPDADASGVTLDVLTKWGRNADISGILHYEDESHFRCYALEVDPSISTNIHILHALRTVGWGEDHPTVQKVVSFLHRTRADRFWFDKWHSSPYYPTAHAAMVLLDYDKEMAADAIHWIRETQNEDGSWGFHNVPTAEETAYAVQALAVWKRHRGQVPDDVLNRGADWLAEHADPPYPPLWTGKCLYCPTLVVRSAVLSALMLAGR